MKQFIICPDCGKPILATTSENGITSTTYHFDCPGCCSGFDNDVELMKAISIRQPWAYLIASGIKPIENRTWKLPEKYKGKRVLIHAGMKRQEGYYSKFLPGEYWGALSEKQKGTLITESSQHTSAIIGSVEIVDCVINYESIWAEETEWCLAGNIKYLKAPIIYNWILKDPIMFEKPILNVKGKLSFFIPEIND